MLDVNNIEQMKKFRDSLIDRLDEGERAINIARAKGQDTTNWETHWINLSRLHEAVCARINLLEKDEA